MRPTRRHIILFLASGGGVGFSPYAPGTLGTLIAVPFSLALNRLASIEPSTAALALAGLILLAIGIADAAGRILGKKDPPIVVIDEVAGFTLANYLNEGVLSVIVAFALFRIFDIAKIFPAARLEALPGGAGIVLDDMMAGLYTFAVLRLLWSSGFV